MTFDAVWNFVRLASDRWDFVLGLLAAMILLNLIPKTKTRTGGMLFPAFLLVARKVAFSVPVVGTMSTADRVIFWSVGAFVYYSILILVLFLIICRSQEELWDISSWNFLWTIIGSVFALPVDGWCHLYMPAVCILGVPKILIVSRVLLPLIWIGFLTESWAAFFARGRLREINKLLLICILIGGFVQFAFQALNFALSSTSTNIRHSWTEEIRDYETVDFLGTWAVKLPQINRDGVNLVEKPVFVWQDPRELKKIVVEIPDAWDIVWLENEQQVILMGGVLFLLLFVLVERFRWADERKFCTRRGVERSILK